MHWSLAGDLGHLTVQPRLQDPELTVPLGAKAAAFSMHAVSVVTERVQSKFYIAIYPVVGSRAPVHAMVEAVQRSVEF